MNLKLYALFDAQEKKYFNLGLGVEDQDFCKWIIGQLNEVCSHVKEEEKPFFIDKVRSCQVFRLAEIDEQTGNVLNDKQYLIDLKDFEVKDNDEIKQ